MLIRISYHGKEMIKKIVMLGLSDVRNPTEKSSKSSQRNVPATGRPLTLSISRCRNGSDSVNLFCSCLEKYLMPVSGKETLSLTSISLACISSDGFTRMSRFTPVLNFGRFANLLIWNFYQVWCSCHTYNRHGDYWGLGDRVWAYVLVSNVVKLIRNGRET